MSDYTRDGRIVQGAILLRIVEIEDFSSESTKIDVESMENDANSRKNTENVLFHKETVWNNIYSVSGAYGRRKETQGARF